MAGGEVQLVDLVKRFGEFTAVAGITLDMPSGEFFSLLGPSGCGKTTTLRMIAGFERPSEGQILLDGVDMAQTPPHKRDVNTVFQSYALFPHLTVEENVAFGLRVRPRGSRPPAAEIRAKVMDLLKLVQLDWLADRRPSELSGGQRQRVALARALAVEPKVLLLDEPFGSLDARIRQELRRWLRRLHDDIRLTSVFVTHDQEEALDVADRVVVMNRGRIEQMGTPQEVFEHPATPFVMTFIGQSAVFAGTVQGGKAFLGPLAVDYPAHLHEESLPASGYARPHELEVSRVENGGGGLWATLRHASPAGAVVKLDLSDGEGRSLQAEVTREQSEALQPRVGERLYVKPRKLRIFVDG
jgi:sulfate transport system ATP-binding protein